MESARLTHLLNLYFDGALAGEEKAELERALLESAAARRTFWEHAALHGLVYEAAKLKWAENSQVAGEAAAVSPVKPARASDLSPRPVSIIGFGWGWRWGLAAAGAAGLVFIGLILGGYMQRDVAVLARAVEASWEDENMVLSTGSALKPGWLHLKRGAVQVDYRSGARVVFEGPAQIRIRSGNRAFCGSGRFRVHVPEQARGFRMETAGLDLVDWGTEFGLNLPPTGPAEVHVFSGRVDLARTGPVVATVHLREGQAVRVESDAFRPLPADPAGFVTELDLARRDLPEVRRRRESWKEASLRLKADSAARLHYTCEDQPPWGRILNNQIPGALPETHGQIVGCEWTEGRWPGKKALRFTGAGDRVRLRLPQVFQEVSCVVWVRVDGLPNDYVHSLMTGDSEGPGTLRWTISHEGQIRIGVASQSNGPEASWAVGVSPPVVTSQRLGQWIMLAMVYDGKTANHYLDGQLVWSGPVRGPGTCSFGWVEIGNWAASPDHPDFQWAKGRPPSFFARNFTGCIDEVVVLSRAMTSEEIRRFYASGRPLAPETVAAQPQP